MVRFTKRGFVAAILCGVTLMLSAPASACTGAPQLYFNYGSSDLTEASLRTLQSFVSQYGGRRHQILRIEVIGHSDRTGALQARRAIAGSRALRVRDFLVMQGFPAALLTLSNAADSRPEVETPDGVREPNNRRVSLAVTFTPAALEEEARQREAMIQRGQPVPMC